MKGIDGILKGDPILQLLGGNRGGQGNANGHVLQGLVNRRAKEAALFGSDAPSGGNPPSPPSPPAPPGGSRNYTVQPGDTLSAIAARQGVSLKALEAANPQIRDFNHIYPGQVIHLPGGGGSAASGGSYTVKSGDTMSGIAARHDADHRLHRDGA